MNRTLASFQVAVSRLAHHVRVHRLRAHGARAAGQSTLEYVGMVVAVVVVLALVVAAIKNYDLAARIKQGFDSVLTG